LTSAEAGYEKRRSRSETQLQNKDQAVKIAKMNLERAQKDFDMANEDLKAYEIKAPVDGTVNYGDRTTVAAW